MSESRWWKVNISPGNGLAPSGTKPDLCSHMSLLAKLIKYTPTPQVYFTGTGEFYNFINFQLIIPEA